MEIIEIKSINELPSGVEMVLYEPPFYGDEIQETASQFKSKYGNEPQTIYKHKHQLFVVKNETGTNKSRKSS
jgi:hypothetical protein